MKAVCDGVEAISMREKFVIVTNRRSGSNLLVSMLNSHPQIKCFRELMRATPRGMKKQGYRGVFRILDKVDDVYKNDRYRFGHPFEFLGVESSVQLEPGTEKRNPSTILARFSNDRAAMQAIETMDCSHWAYEEMLRL